MLTALPYLTFVACCFLLGNLVHVHCIHIQIWSIMRKAFIRPRIQTPCEVWRPIMLESSHVNFSNQAFSFPWLFLFVRIPESSDVGLERIPLGLKITIVYVIAFQKTAFVTKWPWCLALAHLHLCSHYSTKLLRFVDSISGVWFWNIVEVQRLCVLFGSQRNALFVVGQNYLLND